MSQLALLGGGAMAEALIKGALASGFLKAADIQVAEPVKERREALSARYGVQTTSSNKEAAQSAQRILLAVKPGLLERALEGLGDKGLADKLVISILAGAPLARLRAAAGAGARLARAMPNTPCMVLAGATAVCFSTEATEADRAWTLGLFKATGHAEALADESLMDAVTGLSGSGPAYLFEVIEAMADGGVAVGLPRATALALAAQTMLGAARMVIETGEHPAALKDKVASPNGTTISGLRELETRGMRSAFIEAVARATQRSKELARGG